MYIMPSLCPELLLDLLSIIHPEIISNINLELHAVVIALDLRFGLTAQAKSLSSAASIRFRLQSRGSQPPAG